MGQLQRVTVLGSTGSIGVSTLDVIGRHPEKFAVFALTAHSQVDVLLRQCQLFKPVYAVITDESQAVVLRRQLADLRLKTEVLIGIDGLLAVASASEVDVLVAAIVGAAGLMPTMAAVKAGKRVLLANKESLVMAGRLFMREVELSSARLLPVDSEHNAIFQCLPAHFTSLDQAGIKRILLTGSGGPFRTANLADLDRVTPDQACAHPNWSMGRKISVDSATMMNKGLEYIEACWLFGARPEQIEVILHPQSIVHSMVEYVDGSVLAQMGVPDMRTPIAHCLAWPDRLASGAESLDFLTLGALEFSRPEAARFPCLGLAVASMLAGGTAPAALNAANEVAVDAFLNRRIGFVQIAHVVDGVMQAWHNSEPVALADVEAADREARELALNQIQRLAPVANR